MCLLSYIPGQFKNTLPVRKRCFFLLQEQPRDNINQCDQAGASSQPRTGATARPSSSRRAAHRPAPPAAGAPGVEGAATNHRFRNRFPDLSLVAAGRGRGAGGGGGAAPVWGRRCARVCPRAGNGSVDLDGTFPESPGRRGQAEAGLDGKIEVTGDTYSRATSGKAFLTLGDAPAPLLGRTLR